MNLLFEKEEPLAIELKNSFFKVAKLKKKGKFFEIEILEKRKFKKETSLEEKGKVIEEFLRQKKLKSFKYVITAVPEEEVFLSVISLPKMDFKEAKKAAIYEAQNYIPLPISSAQIDAQVIGSFQEHLHILIGAVKKKVIDDLVKILSLANLIPLVIEPESKAIARAVIFEGERKSPLEKPQVILDIGEERTVLIISQKGKIRFSSAIQIGEDTLIKNIAKNLSLKKEEAQKIKERYGLLPREKALLEAKEEEKMVKRIIKDNLIQEAVIPAILDLLEQTKKYIEYYLEKAKHKHLERGTQIEKIVLSGKEANLKGLKEFIEDYFKVNVLIANPLINILPPQLSSFKDKGYKEFLEYSVALGLALRAVKEKLN